MKYAVLAGALELRGQYMDVAELAGGKPEPGGLGMMLPRPRGRVMTVSTARIAGGPREGAHAVLLTEESYAAGDREPGAGVTFGYADEDEAYQDVLRLVAGTALKDGTVEAVAGWGGDAVVLVPGAFGGFYPLRIASVLGDPDRSALYPGEELAPEDVDDLGGVFADMIDELIDDLARRAEDLSAQDPDEATRLRELALPWLRKEAAQHRAASARRHFADAADPADGVVGPGGLITMSALARNLYTDRGNLTRAIKQALAKESGPW